MLHHFTTIVILAATSVISLPLNINLGAYSPALVVGDGEISFGGEEDVSNLMTALSGASQVASVSSATSTAIQRAGVESVSEKEPAVIPATPAVEAQPSDSSTPSPPASLLGIGRNIGPRVSGINVDVADVEKGNRDVETVKPGVEERDLVSETLGY